MAKVNNAVAEFMKDFNKHVGELDAQKKIEILKMVSTRESETYNRLAVDQMKAQSEGESRHQEMTSLKEHLHSPVVQHRSGELYIDTIIEDEDEDEDTQRELFLLLTWILFFLVSVVVMTFIKVKLVNAVCVYLCLTLALSTFQKEYNLATPVEYIVVAFCYFYGIAITFSVFSWLKMMVSLVMCIFEICVESTASHSSFMKYRIANTNLSNNLSPGRFFCPCIGFGIVNTRIKIMKKLYQCGKSHDWAVFALYLFSTQNYLAYSALRAYRMSSWIIFFISLIAFEFYEFGDNKDIPTRASVIINFIISLPDVLLLLVTLYDVRNFRKERLEDNRAQVDVKHPHRGTMFDLLKLLLLMLLLAFCPHQTAKFGYFIYFLSTVVARVVTYFII